MNTLLWVLIFRFVYKHDTCPPTFPFKLQPIPSFIESSWTLVLIPMEHQLESTDSDEGSILPLRPNPARAIDLLL